jgi:hypothetical protein
MYRFTQLLSLMILIQLFGFTSGSNAAQNGSCGVASGEITEAVSAGNHQTLSAESCYTNRCRGKTGSVNPR